MLIMSAIITYVKAEFKLKIYNKNMRKIGTIKKPAFIKNTSLADKLS